MPRFSANLSMMFQEHSFLDRFAAAKDAGFNAVEFLFPYDHSPDVVGKLVEENALDISVFNLFPGHWEGGERGLAALPEREADFKATVSRALPYAQAMGAKRLHAMAGVAAPTPHSTSTYIKNMKWAAEYFAQNDLELLLEPINARSMPGYFLSSTNQAIALMRDINHPALRLQFDIFHHQITHGDVMVGLRTHMAQIGHIQIAGVPERHEPDQGELNYNAIFDHIDALGYQGWIGCEYIPANGTVDGLRWLRAR